MKLKTAKIIIITIIVLIVLLLLTAGAATFIYYRQLNSNSPVEMLGTARIVNQGPIRVGDTVNVVCVFKAPWHWRALESSAACAEGTKLSSPVRCRKSFLGIGYWIWQLEVKMVVYRSGSIKSGKMSVTFHSAAAGDDKGPSEKTFDPVIPSFTADALQLKDNKLLLADAVPGIREQARRYLLIAVAVVVLALAAVIIYIVLRRLRKRKLIVLTPWESAITKIHALQQALKDHKISLENCFSQLTDIVRDYLEKRFKLKAPAQTTPEFLESLRRDKGKLSDQHRHFLKDFMTAADLIKFAKLPPEETDFYHALDKARILVNETRPDQNEQKIESEGRAS